MDDLNADATSANPEQHDHQAMSTGAHVTCKVCGSAIPEQRLRALPHTKVCVACISAQRVAGFQVITSKTSYAELQLVEQATAQELYAKQDRKGSIATGVIFRELPPPKLSNFE